MLEAAAFQPIVEILLAEKFIHRRRVRVWSWLQIFALRVAD
jgi:hypothetical protein